MKRLLPLVLLSLLLLAPTARGGDLENIARDIQDVDIQMQYLQDALDQTEDAHKRAALQGQLDNARAHRAKLEADRVSVRALLAAAASEFDALRERAESMQAKTTALYDQVLSQRKAFQQQGDLKRLEAMQPTLEHAEHDMGEALMVHEALARTEAHLRKGELSGAQVGLMEAEARLDDLDRLIGEKKKVKRAAAAAERAAEVARRAKTAAEIAKRTQEADAGIAAAKDTRARLLEALELATNSENVKEVKRIQERMARFEEHAAKFHVAEGWLEKARAQLDGADILEAQKALVQAKLQLQRAARTPLDDGRPATWPTPEFKTQRAEIEILRHVAANSLARALSERERLTAQLVAADGAGNGEAAERLQEQATKLAKDGTRLAEAGKLLEQARTLIDKKQYEQAKQAFEKARNRLGQLEALRAGLRGLAEESDRPSYGDPAATEAYEAVLRTQIAELEAQLARLSEKVTDKHPSHIQLSQRIRTLKERLAALESQPAVRTLVTDADGHFVISGLEDGKYRVRLVTGDHAVVRGRVVGPDGEVVTEPTLVRKPVPPVVTRVYTPPNAETRGRIDHLRQAAKHLREAGQTEQAERLEQDAKELEDSLRRYTFGRTTGRGNAQVMEAIGDLRQEVRALRREVKELKQLILENRRTGVR